MFIFKHYTLLITKYLGKENMQTSIEPILMLLSDFEPGELIKELDAIMCEYAQFNLDNLQEKNLLAGRRFTVLKLLRDTFKKVA